jgi:hypothetical protein
VPTLALPQPQNASYNRRNSPAPTPAATLLMQSLSVFPAVSTGIRNFIKIFISSKRVIPLETLLSKLLTKEKTNSFKQKEEIFQHKGILPMRSFFCHLRMVQKNDLIGECLYAEKSLPQV